MKKLMVKIGAYAFMIGVLLALVAGFMTDQFKPYVVATLVVLGLIVGFLNVTESETNKFLMAAVAVMIALFTAGSAIQQNLGALKSVGNFMWNVMTNINVFVFPATIVVAVRAIFSVAHD